MRKVIVSNLVSLDGFIARSNGDLDWFVVNDEFFNYSYDLLTKVDTILFGRNTYQGMANYWPTANPGDSPMVDKMNQHTKIVFSTTLDSTPWGAWNNARLVKDEIGAEITNLKQQSGKDMVIYGSGSIVSILAQLGLIDEYQLVICPVILGKGISQFKDVEPSIKLNLIESRPFKNGSILSYYTPSAV